MYSISSYFLKMPKDLATLRRISLVTQITKPLLASNIVRNYSNYNKNNDSKDHSRQNPYNVLCYSLLFGAAAYTSYKLW